MKKKYLVLEDVRNWNYVTGDFLVKKVVNSTDFYVGKTISKTMADMKIMAREWTVTILEHKPNDTRELA